MKIMICYDGSVPSTAALNEAKRVASNYNAETFIVTSMVTEDRFHDKEIAEAKSRLEEARENFETEGLPCSTHLSIRGLEAAEDIVRLAEESNVDLIVVGIRKRSQVGKLLMGSVAQYVILKARCPVLCVK
jgi:nucleotide-binding universal stress UspA family protein